MNDDLPADDAALLRAGRRALRELPDAPEWLVLRAQALWQPLPRQAPPLLARVLARLSFDSWASPAPALRGSAEPGARQWLFNAEGRDIDLRIRRIAATGETWSIEGHVLGPDEGGQAEVESVGDAPMQAAALDDLGAFRFDGLGAGPCRLTLRFADASIELPPIDLGPSKADG